MRTAVALILTTLLTAVASMGAPVGPDAGSRRAPEIIVCLRDTPPPVSPTRLRRASGIASLSALSRPQTASQIAVGRPASLQTLDREFGLRQGHRVFSPSRSVWVLRFAEGTDVEDLCEAYASNPHVLYAEPNSLGTLSYVPTDPLYAQTSADLSLIGVEDAWDVQAGATSSVLVAVVDSGVEAVHPDLAAALDLGTSYNFVDGDTNVFDDLGHGTRVAGIIAATGNNAEGIAGIAFGSRVMSLDIADSDGVITTADVAAAINWAVANDADIINLSLRFSGSSLTLQTACNSAAAAGALLVAAAGNEGQGDAPVYPASYDSVVGVGAVADDGITRASFSNYNGYEDTLVDLVAPGLTVFSSIPGSQYNGTFGSGTSYAAAMVSGVAALIRTHDPSQSAKAIRNHLLATAGEVPGGQPTDNWAGSGLLSASDALQTPMAPALEIADVTVDDDPSLDSDNDGDGVLDQGETARLIVTLTSTGADAINVIGTLSTADPDIGPIASAEAFFGTVISGDTVSNSSNPFATIVVSDTSGVKDVEFDLALTGDGGYGDVLSFTLETERGFTVNAGSYFTLQTWTADNTYEVLGLQNFNAGLTIEAGTTIKLAPGAQININAGSLTAVGTSEEQILFTSLISPTAFEAPGASGPIGPQNEPIDLGAYDQVRYVSQATGSDLTGDGSIDAPWATPTHAISQIADASSSNRYVLLIAEGTYTDSSFSTPHGQALQMRDNIDLCGGFTPTDWSRDLSAHSTVLDGQENRDHVVVGSSNMLLDGFTIIGGHAVGTLFDPLNHSGAGFIGGNGGAIRNCTFRDNFANRDGSAIYTRLLDEITQCAFISNLSGVKASGGGTVNLNDSETTVSGCLFYDNLAQEDAHLLWGMGGAIDCDGGAPTIRDSVFIENIAGTGGAISLRDCSVANISHCTLVDNSTAGNHPSSGGGAIAIRLSDAVVEQSVFMDNEGNVADCILTTTSSNVSVENCVFIDNPSVALRTEDAVSAVTNCTILDSDVGVSVDSSTATMGVVNSIIRDNSQEIVGTPTVTFSDVQGGYSGDGNIDEDPHFTEDRLWGIATDLSYDANRGTTRVMGMVSPFSMENTTGRIVRIGEEVGVVATHDPDLLIFGDMTQGLTGGCVIPVEILPTHQLLPGSPCIDAGTNVGAPSEDILGNPRPVHGGASLTTDIGAVEYNPEGTAVHGPWSQINITAGAESSTLAWCTVENGAGVFDQSTNSQFTSCDFTANAGWGLEVEASAQTVSIEQCVAYGNALGGIRAVGQNMAGCVAMYNLGVGLQGRDFTSCLAEGNAGHGMVGNRAVSSEAMGNGGDGFNAFATVHWSRSEGNVGYGVYGSAHDSVVLNNGGIGVRTSARNSDIIGNGGGGVGDGNGWGFVRQSRIINNGGVGVNHLTEAVDCEILDNAGSAAIDVNVIDGCVIVRNGGGVSGHIDGPEIMRSYIAQNAGGNVIGGIVDASTIIANQGVGIQTLDPLGSVTAVTRSWIMFNSGAGIDAPTQNVMQNTIAWNGGDGVRNMSDDAVLNSCNIFGNGGFDYFDDENTATGFEWKDVRNNWWGPETTAVMASNPFPSVDIEVIYDAFDNSVINGWYANYGASDEIAVVPVPNAPGAEPPACLIDVTPNLDNAVNVGLTTFTLVFSEAMETDEDPTVTFGSQAPYSQNVVEPDPGWIEPRIWQGTFDISAGVGVTQQTIRVSGAVADDGFEIPDDTFHQFLIDTEGGLAANNGLASAVGKRSLLITWTENGRPPLAQGYNIRRSTTGVPGSYQRINDEIILDSIHLDTEVESNTVYFYIVDLIDAGSNAIQWTPPFFGVASIPDGPPIIEAIDDLVIPDAMAFTMYPVLTQGSDPIAWTLQVGPASMQIDSETGIVTWPEPAIAGSPHTVTIQASNGEGVDQATWQITVVSMAEEIMHHLLGEVHTLVDLDANRDGKVDAADLVWAVNGSQ